MEPKLGIVALLKAVKKGDFTSIEKSITTYGLPKNGTKTSDYLILQTALERNQVEIAKLLIQKGCRVNYVKNDYGQTPLGIAITRQYDEIIKLLFNKHVKQLVFHHFECGYMCNSRCNSTHTLNPTTALIFAIENNLINMFEVLLQCNIDVNYQDNGGKTALHCIIEYPILYASNKKIEAEQGRLIGLLLAKGASINLKDLEGKTVLHYAAEYNKKEILLSFLQINTDIDVNACDNQGDSVLHILLSSNSNKENDIVDIVNQLVLKGARGDILDRQNRTAYNLAAKNKYLIIIQILLQNKYNVNHSDNEGKTILHSILEDSERFSRNNLYCIVVKFVLSLGAMIDVKDKSGKTPLHIAAENRQTSILDIILPNITDVNICDNNGNTVLHALFFCILHSTTSIDFKDIMIIKHLLSRGARVDSKNKDGSVPVHLAFKLKNKEIILLLLQHVTNVNICDNDGKSILHCLSESKSIEEIEESKKAEIVKIFLEKGAIVDIGDKSGQTPLHVAVINKRIDVVRLLLEYGANVCLLNSEGLTLSQILVKSKVNTDAEMKIDIEIMEMLTSKGAEVDVLDKNGLTVLHSAARSKKIDMFATLLGHCTQVHICDSNGNTVLHTLLDFNENMDNEEQCVEIVILLLSKGALVNVANSKGQTPLHLAAKGKHNQVSQILILNGADISICDEESNTVLHFLSMLKVNTTVEQEMVKLFISHGSPVNAINDSGMTPLLLAAQSGCSRMISALLMHGANIHCTAGENMTMPIHLAAEHNHSEVIETLLMYGADINAMRKDGKTALHIATMHKQSQITKLLLNNKADALIQDKMGKTALHWACWHNNLESVNDLLNYGADINILDNYHATPIMLSQNHDKLISTLLANHAMKLQAANAFVADANVTCINIYKKNNLSIGSTFTMYKNEILKLEKIIIGNNTSLIDILHMSANRLSIYKSNVTFQEILHSDNFKQQHPYYIDLIKGYYQKGIVRSDLMQSAKNSFRRMTSVAWPDICCEKIFSYLNNNSLHSLIKGSDIRLSKRKNLLEEIESIRPIKRARRVSI